MPVVICKSHGRKPGPEICRHAAEAVWANRSFEKVTFVDLDGFTLAGWLCKDCLALNEIQPFRKSPGTIHQAYSEAEIERLLGLGEFQLVRPKRYETLVSERYK